MPMIDIHKRWQLALLAIQAGACCGFLGSSGVRAQSLDLDANPAAPAPVASPAGGPDTGTASQTPVPPKPLAEEHPRSTVQDGIVPLNIKTAPDAEPPPAAPPTAIPPPAVAAQPPPGAEPITLDHPKVIDTAKLQAGETTVSLYAIEGLGGESAQGLQGFISAANGRITCQAHGDTGFVCLLPDGTDVAQVALVNGAARTTEEAPESYRLQEADAQAARRGVWVNLPPPPEIVKHPAVRNTATLTADGKTYALDGVEGFAAPYSSQLQGYIAANGDSVTCAPQAYPGHYICLLVDGTDVAKVALVNGAARVGEDPPDSYRVQQLDALNNRRGYWATASDAAVAAALIPQHPQEEYVLTAGDEGVDGISYVGGAPVAVIEGESVFLVYGDDLGWGYYDHFHHWHGAPDRFRHHMEHFHPGGHGLRGHDEFRGGRDLAGHLGPSGREIAGHAGYGEHENAAHAGYGGHEAAGHAGYGGHEGAGHAGYAGHETAAHAGYGGHEAAGRAGYGEHEGAGRAGYGEHEGTAHPGQMTMAGRPGFGGAPVGRPGVGGAPAGRPGFGGGAGGGFMRPVATGGMHAGGFGGGAVHASAPRASGGGGGGGKHK